MTQTYTRASTRVENRNDGEHAESTSCSASSCRTLQIEPQHHRITYTEALSLVHPPSTPAARRRQEDAPANNDDAPTPLTSNCRLPKLQPPSLELTPSTAASATHPSTSSSSSLTKAAAAAVTIPLRAPRFSSPSAPPIVMQRPIVPTASLPVAEYRLGLYPAPPPPQRRTSARRISTLLPERRSVGVRLLSSSSSSSSSFAGPQDDLLWSLLSAVSEAVVSSIQSILVKDALVVSSRPPQRTRPTRLPPTPPSRSHEAAPSRVAMMVRGIPNYGQTCFVNSVLQALASLEPFGEYLERVMVRGQTEGIFPSLPVLNGSTLPLEDASKQPLWLCSELRQILHAINGSSSVRRKSSNDPHDATTDSSSSSSSSSVSSLLLRRLHHLSGGTTSAIDPRPILRRVGQQYAIFRPKPGQRIGRDQQDAQEFLQALLGLVADDSGISATPAAVPCFLAGNEYYNNNNCAGPGDRGGSDSDCSDTLSLGSDTVTVASAARERKRSRVPKHNFDLLGRTVASPAPLDVSQLTLWSATSSNDAPAVKSVHSTVSTASTQLLNGSNGDHHHHRRLDQSYDEKKQDEFYLPTRAAATSPPVSYEAFDEASADSQPSTSAEHSTEGQDCDSTSRSDASYCKGLRLSAAIRRMLSTTSSITPSPLTGWMGSALQCRTCHHVRPIQNVPFLDIPIVPTNVSNYLHRRQGMDHLHNPSKFRPTDVGPPCTLEQCLEDFTSVERVHDVECRCCTVRRAVAELDDEALLLRRGIEALSSKAHKVRLHGSTTITDSTPDPAKHLRDELANIQRKLDALRATSPDDEGALERILAMDDPLGAEQPSKVPLHRSDAFKCLLLTRLPAVLCIHVQRRFYDPSTDRTAKTAQHVIFPEYLNVGPYCAYGGGDSMGSEAAWAGTLSGRTGRTQVSMLYRLASVVVHAGGAFFGHYFSYRRDPYSDRWLWISDDTVRKVDWNTVRESQAYMLFYEAV